MKERIDAIFSAIREAEISPSDLSRLSEINISTLGRWRHTGKARPENLKTIEEIIVNICKKRIAETPTLEAIIKRMEKPHG